MQVSVEDINSVKKTLHIEIPEADVASELDKAYNELKKRAKVKGFRPGKVPRSVVVRLFKKDVHADVTSKLIQSSFMDALKETDLNIVGTPQVNPPELQDSGPYNYDATVEISPEIEDIDYKGLTLKRTNYKISDEEVDTQLKMLQKNMAQHQKVEAARPAQDGDFVLIDYEGFKDGRPFAETAKTENFNLKIGEGPIIKDFDDQLVGLQPGDSKEFAVKFPADYFNDKLKDLEISFQVTLNEIREEVLPAIDDVLAKKAGQYESLDDLKKIITENLEQGYAKRVDQELNEQIFTHLIEKSDFEVPDAMVDMELEGIVNEAERSFAYRNITLEEMGLSKESIAEKYRDTALKQVKRHLILGKMIKQEELALSDDELEDALNEMATSFNQPVAEIKTYYDQNKDKLEYFKHTILEKKAIKLIIDTSKIEDVEPEKEPAVGDESETAAADG
ncbi:Cell division trigger factor (EC [Olavius sp. associated proteobacterium Delta 1]|nr:Cell division trigger factor (EC [Olavius sp. associated proteobacterium Delta 1]